MNDEELNNLYKEYALAKIEYLKASEIKNILRKAIVDELWKREISEYDSGWGKAIIKPLTKFDIKKAQDDGWDLSNYQTITPTWYCYTVKKDEYFDEEE